LAEPSVIDGLAGAQTPELDDLRGLSIKIGL
jgi:hypothetical protein